MAIFDKEFDEDLIDDFKDHFSIMTSTIGLLVSKIKDTTYSSSYNENIDELYRIFHNIGSSSIYFRLHELSIICKKTEAILSSTNKESNENCLKWLSLVHSQFELWLKEMLNSKDDLSKTCKEILMCKLFNIEMREL
jgi:two-component system chemotaxis sensor kinase CheA